MNSDEDIDAVASASVNMDGSNVFGNAQLLAEMTQEVTGGDLFFIETVEKYPAEYRGTTDLAKTEQNADARPELSSHVENMDAYDTVILIYSVWCMPSGIFYTGRIDPVEYISVSQQRNGNVLNVNPPAMRAMSST